MRDNIFRDDNALYSWALLIIRIAVGIVFVAHGSQKLFGAFGGPGIGGVIGMVSSLGFKPPLFWAWMLVFVEFFGGLAILFGLLTRLAAFAILVDMLIAISKVHGRNGFFLPTGFEYAFTLGMIMLALIVSGAGRFSLDWYLGGWWRHRKRRS